MDPGGGALEAEDAGLPGLGELNIKAELRGGKKFALKHLPSNRRARMLNEQFR
jgi:hypothetical protein